MFLSFFMLMALWIYPNKYPCYLLLILSMDYSPSGLEGNHCMPGLSQLQIEYIYLHTKGWLKAFQSVCLRSLAYYVIIFANRLP